MTIDDQNFKLGIHIRGFINELYLDDLRKKRMRGLEGQELRGLSAGENCPRGWVSFSPPFYSSSEAGHPHCHSLRSLFFPWKRSDWLRIPLVLCVLLLRFTKYDIRFMADAAATNSNFRRNNRTHQNTSWQPYLYQNLSQQTTQLRLLGMPYPKLAKSLNINKRTAMRACKYGRR